MVLQREMRRFQGMHCAMGAFVQRPAYNAIFPSFFRIFFGRSSIYLAPSGAKYCEKGFAAIGKSFGKGLGRFWKKLNFQAVIKSAASAADLITALKV